MLSLAMGKTTIDGVQPEQPVFTAVVRPAGDGGLGIDLQARLGGTAQRIEITTEGWKRLEEAIEPWKGLTYTATIGADIERELAEVLQRLHSTTDLRLTGRLVVFRNAAQRKADKLARKAKGRVGTADS